MRVNPNNISNTGASGSASQSSSTASAQGAKKTDRVKTEAYEAAAKAGAPTSSAKTEISDKAREMAKAKQVATDAPDVREAKIAALREQIANKKYNVNPEAVADRLVDDHLRMGGA